MDFPDRPDYRRRFRSAAEAAWYDTTGYAPGTYADLLYQLEMDGLRRIVGSLSVPAPAIDLLDFACGTGRIVLGLEAMVGRSFGVDISPEMLARAREKTSRTVFIEGDITSDPRLCRGPFDVIVAFRFFTNAEPELREAALRALRKRLRDHRSRLIFNVHRSLNSYLFFHWLSHGLRAAAGGDRWNYLSIPATVALAKRCGLRVESVAGFGFLSSHVAGLLPFATALGAERMLASVPLLNLLGSQFIVVCSRDDRAPSPACG